MYKTPALAAATMALAIFASGTAFAMTGDMMMGSKSSMAMAKCHGNDHAVIMNPAKHTYMLDTKANRDAMKGMMSHDKFMCESQAKKMGAKMASAPGHAMNKM